VAGIGEKNTMKATPAISGDMLFFADDMGLVYCLDLVSGDLRWKSEGLGSRDESLLIYGNRLYTKFMQRSAVDSGWETGYLCLSFEGKPLWKFQSRGPVLTLHAAAADGLVFFGDRDGLAYGVSAESGEQVWLLDTNSILALSDPVRPRMSSVSGPTFVVGDTVVFHAGTGSHLIALDSTTGRLKWVYEAPAPMRSVACSGSAVFHTTFGGRVFAVDVHSGEAMWEANNQEYSLGDIAGHSGLVVDGIYFAGFNRSRKLAAFSTSEGKVVWTFQAQGRGGFSAPPSYVGGNLIIGNDYGVLHCFKMGEPVLGTASPC
jgi:outer membrane protein assembly factor BamB